MVYGLPRKFISKVAKWRSLSAAEKGLFFRALLLLLGVQCLLKLLPFRLWRPLLLKLTSASINQQGRGVDSTHHTQVKLSQVIRAVEQASRFMPGVKCLARAVTIGILLQRYGFNPLLRLGVRLEASGGFAAHAWVVCGGRVVIGNLIDLGEYKILPLQEGISS